jgi:hypothetical protein
METSKNQFEGKSDADLEALVKAAAQRRNESLASYEQQARRKRLENQVILATLEESGKLVGRDLGVVWLPTGDMIVLKKPTQLAFESYQLKGINGEITAKDLHDYVTPTIVHPANPIEQERLYELAPSAKLACGNLATSMCEVASKNLEGKS